MTPPTCRPSSLAQPDCLLINMRLSKHCRLLSARCAKAARRMACRISFYKATQRGQGTVVQSQAPEEMGPPDQVALWSQFESLGAKALASLSSHAPFPLDFSDMSKRLAAPVRASLEPMTLACRAGKRREAGNMSWWLGVWGHEWLQWWLFRP